MYHSDELAYRPAARSIALKKDNYACIALQRFSLSGYELRKFTDMFAPDEAGDYDAFFGEVTNQNQLARSLALLFMAEMSLEEVVFR